jgi:flagellar hook-basal body complex protein FliE
MVTDLLQSVNGVQNEAAAIQQAYLAGEEVELHQMMIKAEEAGISMDLLLEIRNRLVDAYNDLMKMPM